MKKELDKIYQRYQNLFSVFSLNETKFEYYPNLMKIFGDCHKKLKIINEFDANKIKFKGIFRRNIKCQFVKIGFCCNNENIFFHYRSNSQKYYLELQENNRYKKIYYNSVSGLLPIINTIFEIKNNLLIVTPQKESLVLQNNEWITLSNKSYDKKYFFNIIDIDIIKKIITIINELKFEKNYLQSFLDKI